MKLAATDIARLSSLLDEALDLPPLEREAWLASLGDELRYLGPTLRELLAKEASRETGELIDRLPVFRPAGGSLAEGDAVGPYRLLRELGLGGMGAVWLGERSDGSLKRKVALKLPHVGWAPGLAERFMREREILASLEHPNIARLYEAGIDHLGRPYMALEYVEGQPIDQYCRQHTMSLQARLRLLLQVADAVAFAHSRLVVHRDLKPGNILVTGSGQVRLLDFGIAKLMEGDRAQETALTRAAGRALTLDYASPEQIRGEPIGTASDVYSLGVVAYEVLTSTRPYRLKQQGAAALERAIAELDVPLASDSIDDPALKKLLKGDLDAILNKALKKSVAERYATVDALAQDWRLHLQGQRVLARPDTLMYRLTRWATRYRTLLAAAAVAAVALVLAIGFGATAVVVAALSAGLGAALWQARQAAQARDRALALSERNEAAATFLNLVLTDAARGGETFTAEQLLKRSEELIERELVDGAETRAIVLSMIGTSLQTLGNPAEAIRLHDRALEVAQHSEDQELRDTLVCNRALSIGWAGRVAEARSALEAVVARASTVAERRTEAHHYLASLANANQDATAALHHAGEALRSLRRQRRSSPRFEASLLASLGAACSLNDRMAEADQHFTAATARIEALGLEGSPQHITLLNNWAVLNERAGDCQQSLQLAERALRLGGQSTPRSPFIVSNRAHALERQGRWPEAHAAYSEALQLATQAGAMPARHASLLGLAWIAVEQSRWSDAEDLLARADADGVSALPPSHPNKVRRDLVGGQLALRQERLDAALSGFDAAIGAAPPIGTTVMGLIGRAEVRLQQGAVQPAIDDARAALVLAQRLQGDKPHSWRSGLAALLLARASQRGGDPAEAHRQSTVAVDHLAAMVIHSHPALLSARRLKADTEIGRGP